ncbi:auxin-induced protein 6b [Phtheirospermum japonicum]|uniref:Auxin-induced protein 6b n=1 Tax=Phtheirospermum japonicum TaxID=374723 RepID=A0A830BI61_9LAMI|nr:auxin-induced protein 6b [Phtheirospermum japonicum]
MQRFVVPISCLKNAQFLELFDEAAEVYRFHSSYGKIILPCSESTFLSVLNSSRTRDMNVNFDLMGLFGGLGVNNYISFYTYKCARWVSDRI